MNPSSSNLQYESERPRHLEWIRLFSGYLILTYAIRKLIGTGQFAWGADLVHRQIGTLSGEELTWFYYSYSHAYGTILGFTQLVGGVLLLFRRSALLGAVLLTPVMANILMINQFFYIAAGAEAVAALVLVSCLLLLWHERIALLAIFWSDQSRGNAVGTRAEKVAILIVAALLMIEAMIFVKHPAR